MCVIMVKPKGVKMPDVAFLENAFENNDDGAGMAISKDDKVYVRKGFMTFAHLKDFLDKLGDLSSRTVLLHFRIGTSGKNDASHTHPYPVIYQEGDSPYYDTLDAMMKLEYTAQTVLAHNGILNIKENVYTGEKDKRRWVLNDTQTYLIERLRLVPPKVLKQKWFHAYLEKDIAPSKFVLLWPGNKFKIINEDLGVWDEGIWWSNTSYKEKRYRYKGVGGVYSTPYYGLNQCDICGQPSEYVYWINGVWACRKCKREAEENALEMCQKCGKMVYLTTYYKGKYICADCLKKANNGIAECVCCGAKNVALDKNGFCPECAEVMKGGHAQSPYDDWDEEEEWGECKVCKEFWNKASLVGGICPNCRNKK